MRPIINKGIDIPLKKEYLMMNKKKADNKSVTLPTMMKNKLSIRSSVK